MSTDTTTPPMAPAALDDPGRASRTFLYLLIIAIAGGMACARLMTLDVRYSPSRWPRARPVHTPMFSANDRSRWCTVWSLAERGTYRIDEIIERRGWYTIDNVRVDGHFYSTKPPLLPTLVAGLYWTIKQITGWNLLTNTHQVVQTILLLINVLPMLVYLWFVAKLVDRYGTTDWSRMFLITAAAFGTFLSTFLITFNNHTIAAHGILFALYPTLRILVDRERGPRYFALAGFFAAWATCNELPAALFGVALFALLLRESPRQTLVAFVPAALVPILGFFITNYLATGGVLPFYASYGSELYEYVHNGKASYWTNPRGIDRNLDSPLVYLLHCTVGHHGIWSLSPIFLVTIAGWWLARRTQPAGLRHLCWLSLGLTVAVLGFYLSRPQNYNYGGMTSGLRWAFWLIPLWLLPMIPALDTWGRHRWFRLTCVILLALSVFSAVYPSDNPWQHPWLFRQMEQLGWIDYNS